MAHEAGTTAGGLAQAGKDGMSFSSLHAVGRLRCGGLGGGAPPAALPCGAVAIGFGGAMPGRA